jgi:hypothetical protein
MHRRGTLETACPQGVSTGEWVLVTYHKSLITKSVTTGSDEDVELGVVSVSL